MISVLSISCQSPSDGTGSTVCARVCTCDAFRSAQVVSKQQNNVQGNQSVLGAEEKQEEGQEEQKDSVPSPLLSVR